MLDEVIRLLATFGKAMAIAFNDIKLKSVEMKKNKEFMIG